MPAPPRIVDRRPLVYRRGADPALDRPAHVRAASAIAWVAGRLIVVQDDAAFLAIVDPDTGVCDDVALPAGPGGRRVFDATVGNKAAKPDLESVFADGDLMVALGSGGPRPARQIAVTWRWGQAPQVIAAPRLFDAIAAAVLPGATALNLEGAVADGDHVIVANRGGDRAGDAVSPDALIRIDRAGLRGLLADPDRAPVPAMTVRPVELGTLDGAPLHFTDLAWTPGGIVFLAVAEATSTYFDDGAVTGSVIGSLDDLEWARIPGADKIEGVAAGRAPGELLAVTDPDDPARPGELLQLSAALA
jgi:hypothetical protein